MRQRTEGDTDINTQKDNVDVKAQLTQIIVTKQGRGKHHMTCTETK